jgi:hypothetical protein
MSDSDFQKYSPSERSNLVIRFAANWPHASLHSAQLDSAGVLENRFGGSNNCRLVKNPKRVIAWRTVGPPKSEQEIGRSSFEKVGKDIIVPKKLLTEITDLLLDEKSYLSDESQDNCAHDPDLAFSFSDGTKRLDVFFCLDCQVMIVNNQSAYTENPPFPSYSTFQTGIPGKIVRIAKKLFPRDEPIQVLKED